MSKPIGVTIHHEDKSVLKVPIGDIAAAVEALRVIYGGGRPQGKYNYINADECPIHGPWKAVQAGVSKSTGKSYDAFWACDVDRGEERCTNRPSKEWIETHPAGRNDYSQFAPPEPTDEPKHMAEDFDSLPF